MLHNGAKAMVGKTVGSLRPKPLRSLVPYNHIGKKKKASLKNVLAEE